jgi:hypothetical protein
MGQPFLNVNRMVGTVLWPSLGRGKLMTVMRGLPLKNAPEFGNDHRRATWGVQKGKDGRRPPTLRAGHDGGFRGCPPAAHRRVGHGGPG